MRRASKVYKIDLHTHSTGSRDGSLSASDYRRMLDGGGLDFIAVTDHDSIAFAQKLRREFGEKIIIGEEITAREGELIGLFLTEVIQAGLSALATAKAINEQGGLVYVPHPFETVRKGLPLKILDEIANHIDIVETHNGRAIFQNKSAQVKAWAEGHGKPTAASSDAHGRAGWGRTFSIIHEKPTRENLAELLRAAKYQTDNVGARGMLYPKLNRVKRKFHHA